MKTKSPTGIIPCSSASNEASASSEGGSSTFANTAAASAIRVHSSSIAHQVLPPHQMMRLGIQPSDQTPMFGGGLSLSPRFVTAHTRNAHFSRAAPASPFPLHDARRSTDSESQLHNLHERGGDDHNDHNDHNDRNDHTNNAQQSGSNLPQTSTSGDTPEAVLHSRGNSGLYWSEASAILPDDPAPPSPVKAPFGLRQIHTRQAEGAVGRPNSSAMWGSESSVANASGSPSAWVSAVQAAPSLKSVVREPSVKEVPSGTSCEAGDGEKQKEGLFEAGVTSPCPVRPSQCFCFQN